MIKQLLLSVSGCAFLFLLLVTSESQGQAPSFPFPQHVAYHTGTILPNHISRETLDDSVRSFYRQWKQHYIRAACIQGQKYVWFEGTRGTNICVSEGQGYGMVIVALMAGFDDSAQATYDDLYRFYKAHPSQASSHLMAWCQNKLCNSIDGSTATDGDMDIAYSLLLADAQWGHNGNTPYREEALEMISAIQRQEVNSHSNTLLLSNAISTRASFDTRSSDFMPDHMRAFKAATGNAQWDTVIGNTYKLFRYLQDKYSPEAGLIPDFIQHVRFMAPNPTPAGNGDGDGTATGAAGPATASEGETDGSVTAVPARPHYLESPYDGLYNFNACRVPWRIATDYLLSGDPRSAAFLEKINRWIRSTTSDNPDNISAGYNLDGDDLPKRNFEALCFIGPFTVAAMAGEKNQPWLNKCWNYLVNFKLRDFDYYDNSIKMLNMIILSGNYWSPPARS